jgi:DNA-binding transcriptional regulator YiaG
MSTGLGIPLSFATIMSGTCTASPSWEAADIDPTGAGPGGNVRPFVDLTEALAAFARRWFASIDPTWSVRSVQLQALVREFGSGTGSNIAFRSVDSPVTVPQPAASPSDQVSVIRAALGLNISETARAVGVERPTIYSWLAGRSAPQRAHSIRLARLSDVAARSRRWNAAPISDALRSPGPDGRSLVDLLALDPLPEELINTSLRAMSRRVVPAPGERESVREAARRFGLTAKTRPGAQAEIDWLTGRSFDTEGE